MVTDANNCTQDGRAFVPEPPQLRFTMIQDSVSCAGGQDGAIVANPAGGTPDYQFEVYTSEGNRLAGLSGVAQGEYTVILQDANACRDTGTIQVLEPLPLTHEFSFNMPNCFDSYDGNIAITVEGGTRPYSYRWSDALAQETARAIRLGRGTYSVTVEDAHTCRYTATMELTAPPALSLLLDQDSVSCPGGADGSVHVDVSGGTPPYQTPQWQAPLNRSGYSLHGLKAGTYTVRVTDANACQLSGTIPLLEPNPIRIEPKKWVYPPCNYVEGASTIQVQGGNGSFRFEWDNGSSDPDIRDVVPGRYGLTVFDKKGCQARQEVEIEEIMVGIQYNGGSIRDRSSQDICLGDPADLELITNFPYDRIFWTINEKLDCDTCARVRFLPVRTQLVRARILNIGGCPVETALQLNVDDNCGTAIPNAFSPNEDGINDVFFVHGSLGGLEIEQFQIFNRWGKLVYANPEGCTAIGSPDCGWDGLVNGQAAPQDTYIYQIQIRFLGEAEARLFKGDVVLMR